MPALRSSLMRRAFNASLSVGLALMALRLLWLGLAPAYAAAPVTRPSEIETPASIDNILLLEWSSSETERTEEAAWADYDNDGDLDLTVINFCQLFNDPNCKTVRLYRNDGGQVSLTATWSSDTTTTAFSMAWGDLDNDGDLDLAVGNYGGPNHIYRNDAGTLTAAPVYSTTESDGTYAVAWGDVDADGDLDLAVGNEGSPSRLYRNTGGTLAATAFWSSALTETTIAIAWGDVDNDGDIDLATGNLFEPLHIYRNTGTTLTTAPVYSSADVFLAYGLDWGDYDNDGDLDLVYGGGRLYRNTNGTLSATPVFTPTIIGDSGEWGDYDNDGDVDLAVTYNCFVLTDCRSVGLFRNDVGVLPAEPTWRVSEAAYVGGVAWGDYDNDGALDLATYGPNRLYRNNGGKLTPNAVYASNQISDTRALAWGDYDNDGDLDLAVGNADQLNPLTGQSTQLYRNDGGQLTTDPVYTTSLSAYTTALAWGDYDNDGDLDLMLGNDNGFHNHLYRNDNGVLTASPVYSTAIPEYTYALAWGDVDNDGDLDLVTGNQGAPVYLHRNDSGVLTPNPVWQASPYGYEHTSGVAWGDMDNDGDLDLAVASGGITFGGFANYIYRNDSGALTPDPVWASTELDRSSSVAWGDYDGDGDLDLAFGNMSQPARLYRNDAGTITTSAVWSSIEVQNITDVAWGDYDGDGDLDLLAGFFAAGNTVYRNDGGALDPSAVWFSNDGDYTYAIAWGDVDGDGDLDAAAGNGFSGGQRNKVYHNQRGQRFGAGSIPVVRLARPGPNADYLSAPTVHSGIIPITYTLSDAEGDKVRQVLGYYSPNGGGQWFPATPTSATVTTNLGTRQQVNYSNTANQALTNGGTITSTLNVSSFPAGTVTDVDIWFSITHTQNSDVSLILRAPNGFTTTLVSGVGGMDDNFINTLFDDEAGVLIDDGTAPFSGRFRSQGLLSKFDTLGSPNGNWQFILTDAAGGGSGTLDAWGLKIQGNNGTYVYNWDVGASGFLGQSDNMVFRLVAVPQIISQTAHVPGPYLYGSHASQTNPFRVRGTQVRVMTGASPAANATVYRLPNGQTTGGALMSDDLGQALRTDTQGYLQGRGQMAVGDQLLALYPLTSTETYTLYHTNGTPGTVGIGAHTVTSSGVQTLTVSASKPLLLFTAYVSLEWDSSQDPTYLEQLQFSLQRASEYLYDFTNGQAALGNIVVEQNADDWGFANILVHANNRLRPFAAQGGIVTTETVDFSPVLSDIVYVPGQVHMGATWNRYGTPGATLGDDWAITLAHELGHYLFFLDDVYLGLDNDGFLIPVDTCDGSAMGDLYSDPANTELIADENHWQANCADTLAEQTLHRNEWETMDGWYSALVTPTVINAGPSLMSFDFTDVDVLAPLTPTNPLVDPTFYLNYAGGGASSNESRAYLLRDGQYIIDLGSPFGGQNRVRAWGAKPGDRLCVFDRPRTQFGCEVLAEGDDQIQMREDVTWNPLVQISPVNSTTLNLQVDLTGAVITSAVQARLFPEYGPGTVTVTLSQFGSVYSGTLNLTAPALNGQVQVWVNEPATETNPRREAMVAFAIGGNPGPNYGSGSYRAGGGSYRAGGGSYRAGGGSYRAGGAPIVSPDGQMIFFTENPIIFDEGEFFTIQGMAALPSVPPGRTVIGAGYRLVATPGTPVVTGSVSIQYLSNDVTVAGASEDGLSLYYYDGATWTELPTTRSPYFNLVTAPSQGVGVYALMASLQIALPSPGWNLFAYPVLGSRPITDALLSISGYYTTVYGYDSTDLLDPWKVFDVSGVPTYVNTLLELEFGQGYWINVSQPITLYLGQGGTSVPQSSQFFGDPPTTFYGQVLASGAFTPTAGMSIIARINGNLCGQGLTQNIGGQIVYVVDVNADANANCGSPGATVTFEVAGQAMAQSAAWDNGQLWNVDLSPGAIRRLFLPLVRR